MEIDIYSNASGVVIGDTGVDEIIQNVQTILSTRKGTVPLDREFGIENTFLDQPSNLAIAQAIPEVFEAVERYEPRVKVIRVEFIEEENLEIIDGKMIPKVKVKIL